jgi:AcrR family transcriptional regulator
MERRPDSKGVAHVDPALISGKKWAASTIDEKRARLLRIAEKVFSEHGLEGTSLRAIAKACGWTAPALYTYYETKEDLYGDIIARSLNQVIERIDEASRRAKDPLDGFCDAVQAYYQYYRDNPHQLDLGLYLFSGARPAGVTPEIDRDLNRRFKLGVARIANLHRAFKGCAPEESAAAAADAVVHAIGIVIMTGTRRLRLLGMSGDNLMGRYVQGIRNGTLALSAPSPRTRDVSRTPVRQTK